jgi:A/G-specific adenine glycosylase
MAKANRSEKKQLVVAPAVRGAFRRRLLAWYDTIKRDLPWRRSCDPYAIWVSEVMLQQTQVKTVTPYFQRFLKLFPDVRALARAPQQTVLKAWQGLGYYSRARNLHRAARMVAMQMDGRLPDSWEQLRGLPGSGDYTAAAVLSIAFKRPHAVVDGNVKRVLARLFLMETPANAAGAHRVFQAVADQLLDRREPGDFNQAVMELGATICLTRQPACQSCPLAGLCEALKGNLVGRYPIRLERKNVPREHAVAAVVVRNGLVLFIQRPEKGLLGALWEFAGGRVLSGESVPAACRRNVRQSVGLEVEILRPIEIVHHTYTHFKLTLDVLLCRCHAGRVRRNGPQAHRWLPVKRLRQLPLHGAVLKALPAVEKVLLENTL